MNSIISGYTKQRQRALEVVMRNLGVCVYGKTVCDVGCGTGFFIDSYHFQAAKDIVGVDITSISINNLMKKYPQHKFIKEDISSNSLNNIVSLKFDILNVFDVLYHIVDNKNFAKAIKNICGLAKKDGIILFSDFGGEKNLSVSQHVLFRSKASYEKLLQDNNAEIICMFPLYYSINKHVLGRVKRFKRIGIKMDCISAPIYYYLDRLFLLKNIKKAGNLNLIIVRKK